MPAKKKQPKQRHIQDGGIYTTISASECNAQDIKTSLQGKAWGHLVLVLGRHPEHRSCFRILTITSSPPDYQNTIPFAPLPKDKRHPMQLRLAHFHWLPKNSYLRIEKEYWIEERGLGDEIGRILLRTCQGLSTLLCVLSNRTLEERKEEQMKKWEKSLKQEGGDLELQSLEHKELKLEHQFQGLVLDSPEVIGSISTKV